MKDKAYGIGSKIDTMLGVTTAGNPTDLDQIRSHENL